MLDLLHIENIAIIEQADISFRPGFNVLFFPGFPRAFARIWALLMRRNGSYSVRYMSTARMFAA